MNTQGVRAGMSPAPHVHSPASSGDTGTWSGDVLLGVKIITVDSLGFLGVPSCAERVAVLLLNINISTPRSSAVGWRPGYQDEC